MNATAGVVETVHNAHALMPAARSEAKDYTQYQSCLAQGIEFTRQRVLRGFRVEAGVGTIGAVVDAVVNPNAVDDRKYLVNSIHLTAFSPYPDSFLLKAGKNSLSDVESPVQSTVPPR